jgi:hypothetical protein
LFEWLLAVVLVVAGVAIWRSANISMAGVGTDNAIESGGTNPCGGGSGN